MKNKAFFATSMLSIMIAFGHANAQKGFVKSWQPALLNAAVHWQNPTPTTLFTPTTPQSFSLSRLSRPTPASTAVSNMAMVPLPQSAPVFPTTQLEDMLRFPAPATNRFRQTENNLQKKLREARKALEKQLSFERSTSTSMKNFKLNN